jgi:hypothetical protein
MRRWLCTHRGATEGVVWACMGFDFLLPVPMQPPPPPLPTDRHPSHFVTPRWPPGNKAARGAIAAAKILAPSTVLAVIDRAIQVGQGGMGAAMHGSSAISWCCALFSAEQRVGTSLRGSQRRVCTLWCQSCQSRTPTSPHPLIHTPPHL